MITGIIQTQFLGCPLPCAYVINVTDTVTGINIQVNANAITGEFIILPDFNYSDNPILIQVLGCDDGILYQETFVFPPSETGLQRVWEDLNIIVGDPIAIECQAPPRDPNATLCGFYVVEDTCNNTVCVYNTQNTNWTRISYDFGNGFIERGFDSGCYTYESFGTYIITQTVDLIINGVIVQTCQAVFEFIATQRTLPRASFTIEGGNCCTEDCNDFRQYCINTGDCVRIVPSIFLNNQDCCSEVVLDNGIPPDIPPELGIDCDDDAFICNKALRLDNYNVAINPGTPINLIPEYVLIQKLPSYNIGLSPFTFQFDLAAVPFLFPVWVQPLGNYPANSPRVIWSWQSSNKPCDNLNTPKIEIGCYYTFDDRIQFTIRQTCPAQNEMTIFSLPAIWALFPNGPYKITIVKGTAPNSNDRLNYRIYLNGVDVTDINQFVNTLTAGFDNINLIEGPIAIGVEWNRQSLNNVNFLAPLPLIQNLGQGISNNYGNMQISSFKFYDRALGADEILQYANANCSTDPINRNRLLLYQSFDLESGNNGLEFINSNNAVLFNYLPNRLLPFDPVNNNNSAWFNYCCTEVTSILRVRGPNNNILGIFPWDSEGFFCFEESGLYTLELEVCNCCGCCVYTRNVYVGPKLYTERIDCLSFKLIDNNEYFLNGLVLMLKVYDTEGNVVLDQEYTDYEGNTDFNIILPEDGMYILEYRLFEVIQNEPTRVLGRLLSLNKFVLLDFCNILQCYSKLLQSINCTNCKDCLDDIRLNNVNMNKINILLVNFQAFIYNIITHYGNTEGTFIYDDQYLTFVKEGSYYIDQLKRICGKCNYIGNPKTPLKCLPVKRKACCG